MTQTFNTSSGLTFRQYYASRILSQLREGDVPAWFRWTRGTNMPAGPAFPSFGVNTVTLTTGTPGNVGWINHGLITGRPVTFVNNGDTLPFGISFNTTYYVLVVDSNNFRITATIGGAAINMGGSPSGVHKISHNLTSGNAANNETTNEQLEVQQFLARYGIVNPADPYRTTLIDSNFPTDGLTTYAQQMADDFNSYFDDAYYAWLHGDRMNRMAQ